MLRSWQLFALGSAFFAALTAIFGKLGVAQVNSNMATLIRTVIIFAVTLAIVGMRGEWQRPTSLSANTWVFLVLSGVATGYPGSVTSGRCNWGQCRVSRRSTSSAWRWRC
ncbi:membrane protein [Pandoraea sputorum]|uniref:Membrane protein n=1 Tax=Pandoraea sputorum TaxID=93222 RepID=A0A5E5AWL8_9BURK|nr:membrane protein [Pandoraea sputorum]